MGDPQVQPDENATPAAADLVMIADHLRRVIDAMRRLEDQMMPAGLLPGQRASAANLLHYLSLRRFDLRDLYRPLKSAGLSTLGRAERHAMHNVASVLGVLGKSRADDAPPPVDFDSGSDALLSHTDALFGSAPAHRDVRIMVTMPGDAALRPELARELLDAGMDVMRINCAHDDEAAWTAMIGHLRAAQQETGRACRVMMDLAGPKIRTGAMAHGPRVLRWRPVRDEHGRVVSPARLWLTACGAPAPEPLREGDAVLNLSPAAAAAMSSGEVLRFRDARDRRTRVVIQEMAEGGAWATCDSTAYVTPATVLRPRAGEGFRLAEVPAVPQRIMLREGEALILTADQRPGRAEARDKAGMVIAPARVPFTLPEAFVSCRAGQPVWLDDGKIGCEIESVSEGAMRLRVTHAPPGGAALGPDKGINLPDTRIELPALTPKDERDLEFVARHADIVAYSFVRSAGHVAELQRRLGELGRGDLGLVLKIETRRAFEALPAMLLQLLHSERAGVMIARGDLAVECGYERLAEVQEEILWVCEAAHLPVIWATEVLDRLAKKGRPTRAEITDAAMSSRAECVMLNKGPYIARAVKTLDDILRRMAGHHSKKSQVLRPLGIARGFGG